MACYHLRNIIIIIIIIIHPKLNNVALHPLGPQTKEVKYSDTPYNSRALLEDRN